jgi:hypothetical protein
MITNSSDAHNHAKIILNKRLERDFPAVVTLRGTYKDVQIQIANGEDKNISCSPAAHGIDLLAPHRIIVTRVGTRMDFSHATDSSPRRLRYYLWQAEVAMDGYIAIAIAHQQTFDLHAFVVRIPVRG